MPSEKRVARKNIQAKSVYPRKRNGVFVTVPPGLWRKVRMAAADQEIKLSEFVVAAIERELLSRELGAA